MPSNNDRPEKEKREDAGKESGELEHAKDCDGTICTRCATDIVDRTRKEAEEKAWRAAVEALEEKRTDYSELKSFTKQGRNIGWNSARQQLINAAKKNGVNIEV